MKPALISKNISIVLCVVAFAFNVGPLCAQEALGEKSGAKSEGTPAEEPKEKTATENKPAKGLEEMTAEEKAAAGLDKLTPAELEHLNEWLHNYRRDAEKKAAEKAAETAKAEVKAETSAEMAERSKRLFLKDEALVSHVDGTMISLTGRTVVRLEDGTKWKQANYEDRFRPRVTNRPAVAVFHTPFGYKMRIEGMPDFYVDPVRE